MSIVRTVVRWAALILGVGTFLLYLNSAAYRAWVSGGPPSDNPEGWLFSAGNYLAWSFAFLFAGMGLFILIGRVPVVSKVSIVLLVVSAAFGVFPHAREFFVQDSCLDAGGKWEEKELRCVYH